MPTIETVCAADRYVGTPYQCDAIRQFGRDFTWYIESPDGLIEDTYCAASDAVDDLEREARDIDGEAVAFAADARARLVSALVDSAERHNAAVSR